MSPCIPPATCLSHSPLCVVVKQLRSPINQSLRPTCLPHTQLCEAVYNLLGLAYGIQLWTGALSWADVERLILAPFSSLSAWVKGNRCPGAVSAVCLSAVSAVCLSTECAVCLSTVPAVPLSAESAVCLSAVSAVCLQMK